MASSLPPPRAKPLTAAITGMGRVSILRNTSLPVLPKASPSALVSLLISPMSAPATKLFSPAPVMISARISFKSIASMAASSSLSTVLSRAFSAFGRSMVRRATWPSVSYWIKAMLISPFRLFSGIRSRMPLYLIFHKADFSTFSREMQQVSPRFLGKDHKARKLRNCQQIN